MNDAGREKSNPGVENDPDALLAYFRAVLL